MVIDAGASCSVTPNLSDFIAPPTRTKVSKMEGLNGQTTSFQGSGKMEWDIEDQLGVCNTTVTNAHHVPQANIRLFSPQVCTQEQSCASTREPSPMLNSKGITLGLGDGNSLSFPVQSGSNSLIMLTHKAMHPPPSTLPQHQQQAGNFNNFIRFVGSSTLSEFDSGSLFITGTVPSQPAAFPA